jgi:hypothetical protein
MRETRMDIGFRIRLSALALSENGDAKNWYRALKIVRFITLRKKIYKKGINDGKRSGRKVCF